jgi:hypothetical protein
MTAKHEKYLFSGCPGECFFEAVLEAGGDSHCTYNLLSIYIASKKQASGHPLNRQQEKKAVLCRMLHITKEYRTILGERCLFFG